MTLTSDEIQDLCRRRDAGVVAAAASSNPASAALVKGATQEEIRLLIRDGIEARNTIVEANVGLVGWIVNTNVSSGHHHKDFMQEGLTALVEAVDRWDPSRSALATYATPSIRGAVLALLNTHGGDLHLTAFQARSRRQVQVRMDQLKAAGKPASPADVARGLGKTEEWVRSYAAYEQPRTLTPTGDHAVDIPDATTEERVEAIRTAPIARYLEMLPDHERTALELVHGFTGEPHNMTQAGVVMGVPGKVVSQYVKSGHVHVEALMARFDQQLGEGQLTSPKRPHAQSIRVNPGARVVELHAAR